MGGKVWYCLECFPIVRLLICCPAFGLTISLLHGTSPYKKRTDSSISGPSTNCKSDGDRDGLLLPEFNELVKEFGFSFKAIFHQVRMLKRHSRMQIHSEIQNCGEDDTGQEIKNLKNIVKTLKKGRGLLRASCFRYYGLKEQETAVMELQNRLKINNVGQILGLKIESLKAEKMGLEPVADKEKNPVETESDVQLKLQKLNDLVSEADELRKYNQSLRAENSTLAERLGSVQILATSVLEDDETEALKEESLRLRKQNEDLVKEVEQLQADRCSDAEELVYLRWVNACLR
ncbi:hypothetical protein HAX54_045358 [Datura stramonium]|uniref:Uncharacterized protein n=1 Tax=Datura stramonium TaxID=4076 RepID=A0ABS8WFP0_DATST|nr:hypothetical protein [Datura stramonium]